jgi:hypothetical protein
MLLLNMHSWINKEVVRVQGCFKGENLIFCYEIGYLSCYSNPLAYMSPVKMPACWFDILARQSLSSEAAEEIATKHFRYTCERRVLL